MDSVAAILAEKGEVGHRSWREATINAGPHYFCDTCHSIMFLDIPPRTRFCGPQSDEGREKASEVMQCHRCGAQAFLRDGANSQFTIRFSSASRRNVWAKSGWRCWYCGITPPPHEMTVDHFVPRSKGGVLESSNAVPACRLCNADKADLDLEQFRSRQRKQASGRPHGHPFRRNNYRFAFEMYGWRR